MSSTRVAALLTWAYGVGFGIPTIPVAVYLLRHGRLPTFFGFFPMYGGRWSSRFSDRTFVRLLIAFLLVLLVAAWTAWFMWNGSKAGALLNLLLLPIEAVFWFGFGLPIPWLIGIGRVVLLALGWSSLD
jgi:uncharacterized SAM-binding protein YcdF (DUF218 family)